MSSMNIWGKIFYRISRGIRLSNISRLYKIEDDKRESTGFKLISFCGESGIDYLNAMLISIYKNWPKIPEVIIISDGTPSQVFKEKMIKWPREITIISWEECALSFKNNGNENVYYYASNHIFGKKFVGILYCAERWPVLYSDSDVLWFNYPGEIDTKLHLNPHIFMSRDVECSYDKKLLHALSEENCLTTVPLNAGLIYIKGNFSSFPIWDKFCDYIVRKEDFGNFTEQTFFAILSNHINPDSYWNNDRILIKIDDVYSLDYTLKNYPKIVARHYVSVKDTTFWRDFLIMTIRRNRQVKSNARPAE